VARAIRRLRLRWVGFSGLWSTSTAHHWHWRQAAGRVRGGKWIVTALLLPAALITGCGGSKDAAGATDAVKTFLVAINQQDGAKACGLLTSEAEQRFIPEDGSLDCEGMVGNIRELFIGGAGTEKPDVTVTLDGNNATSKVNGARGPELEKVGDDWKISRVVVIENGTLAP
jgi:hypothetical protein